MHFGQVIARSVQLLWTLLCTALIGNVIASAFAGNPSSVNYAMFVCAYSWAVVLYGFAAAFMDGLAIKIILIALDGFATFLTFIAGVVLAAKLGVHSCGNKDYLKHNELTNGSHNMGKRCHELQASCAFFWFLFATYAASLVLDFFNDGSSPIRRTGIRRGAAPSMSQV